MKLRTHLTSLALALAVTATGLVATAGPAQALTPGYYSVSYSSTLFRVFAGGQHYSASFDQWTRDGSPAPQPVPTDYVRYSWSPAIYAVSYFDDSWEWQQLAPEQWQRAGTPAPRLAGYIKGTTYTKFDTSSELFAASPDRVTHKLSFSEWAASGYQDPTFENNRGYQKLSWTPTIGRFSELNNGKGYPITSPEWAAADFPTPQVVQHFSGDQFCQYSWSSVIYYRGALQYLDLTMAQWQAAGAPRPTAC